MRYVFFLSKIALFLMGYNEFYAKSEDVIFKKDNENGTFITIFLPLGEVAK
jgi:hypothetical protein